MRAQHSKQVVPDPVPSVLNQWTLDTETSSAFSGKRFRGNAITCNGKLIGKLVGFSEDNAKLIVRAVNHADKLAEALQSMLDTHYHMDNLEPRHWKAAEQALAAYEESTQ